MKFFKHSSGKQSIYPEHIPANMEYVIKPDLSGGFWRTTQVRNSEAECNHDMVEVEISKFSGPTNAQ